MFLASILLLCSPVAASPVQFLFLPQQLQELKSCNRPGSKKFLVSSKTKWTKTTLQKIKISSEKSGMERNDSVICARNIVNDQNREAFKKSWESQIDIINQILNLQKRQIYNSGGDLMSIKDQQAVNEFIANKADLYHRLGELTYKKIIEKKWDAETSKEEFAAIFYALQYHHLKLNYSISPWFRANLAQLL